VARAEAVTAGAEVDGDTDRNESDLTARRIRRACSFPARRSGSDATSTHCSDLARQFQKWAVFRVARLRNDCDGTGWRLGLKAATRPAPSPARRLRGENSAPNLRMVLAPRRGAGIRPAGNLPVRR
jgi:hypothetical protein